MLSVSVMGLTASLSIMKSGYNNILPNYSQHIVAILRVFILNCHNVESHAECQPNGLLGTLSIIKSGYNSTQNNYPQYMVNLSVVILNCHYVECCHAEYRGACFST
jgi:hypothetical protein